MCNFCEPILGGDCLPHEESECALKQSAYCPLCGFGLHFQRQCPKLPRKRLAPRALPIASVEAAPQPNAVVMSHTNAEYIEYLKTANVMPEKKIDDNRRLVSIHLSSKGKVVANPPMNLEKSTPPE